MGIRKYKPTTNGLRGMSTLTNTEITATTPEKSLLVSKSKTQVEITKVKLLLEISVAELRENIV